MLPRCPHGAGWCLDGAHSLMTQRRKTAVLPTANMQIQEHRQPVPSLQSHIQRKDSNNTLLNRARSKGKCPHQFAANSVIRKNSFGERKEAEEKLLKRKGQYIPCKRHVKNSSWKETIRMQVQVADWGRVILYKTKSMFIVKSLQIFHSSVKRV